LNTDTLPLSSKDNFFYRVLILANGAYGLRMETMCKGKLED